MFFFVGVLGMFAKPGGQSVPDLAVVFSLVRCFSHIPDTRMGGKAEVGEVKVGRGSGGANTSGS